MKSGNSDCTNTVHVKWESLTERDIILITEMISEKTSCSLFNASFCSLFDLATCKREEENEKWKTLEFALKNFENKNLSCT